MEIRINCNNCFGDFDNAISSIAVYDKNNCALAIEGYTLTIYKICLSNHVKVLQFCDLDTEEQDLQVIFTNEKIMPRNLFWNKYEVSKEDVDKLLAWLRNHWRCTKGDRAFVEAFNSID